MTGGVSLKGRDFLSAGDLSRDEYELLFERASALKADFRAGRRHEAKLLADRTLAVIMHKPSLRTRVTFEAGIAQLGGIPVCLGEGIGLGARESVGDVARNLERWVDAVVVRTFAHSIVLELAAAASIPVVNALDDDEHPCQALADLLTLRERFGRLQGLSLAFVGDGNNVFHSLALAGATLGMEIRLAHPQGYEPSAEVVARAKRIAEETGGGIEIGHDPRQMVAGADAVYTDVWISMGQEAETEARLATFAGYRVDASLMELAAPEAVAMHCLPAHRGQEIADEVLDGRRSLAFEQAENRLHAQKALLVETIGPA